MKHKNLTPQDSHSPSQEQVENKTGSSIPALRCVTYVQIDSLYPSIRIADPSDFVRGITNSDLLDNQTGFIMVYGTMYNVNTSSWAPGTNLYCDVSGVLTDVSNGFPQVGNVLKQHASLGVIQVTCLDTPTAMVTPVLDTDSINMDTVGSSIKGDLRLSPQSASSNNLKATTTIKSGSNKGLHIEYPFSKSDTDGVLKKEDWSTFNNKVSSNDNRLSTQNCLQVKKNAGVGEFATISDALGSIIDSGPDKPYLVKVGPGIFVEPELTVPTYVSIEGASINTTVITPEVGAQYLFKMTELSELSFLTLQGQSDSVGSGFPAILCEDCGDFAQFHKLSIYDFDIGFRIRSITSETIAYLEYVDINGDYSYAIWSSSSNGFFARCQAENFYTYESNSTTKTSILSEGPDSELLLHTAGLIGSSSGGIGIVIKNGTSTEVSGTFFHSFGNAAIISENSGSAPTLEVAGSSFKDCIKDIKIDHPGTIGYFEGYAEASKLEIDPSAPFFITGKDALIITVAKEGGDYLSVKEALDSITDNSPTKPYIISIGPGTFVEDTLISKNNVTLTGSGPGSTIIQVNNPNKNIIEANVSFTISNMSLYGATGANKCAIYVNPTSSGDGISVRNVEFRDNYTFIKLLVNSSNVGIVDSSLITLFPSVSATNPFICESTTGDQALMSVDNLKALVINTIPNFFKSTGPGSFLILTNIAVQSVNNGNGIQISNGSRLVGRLLALQGFDTSVEAENIGDPSTIEILSTILISNVNDLLISHPGTIGSFQGQADNDKITINPSSQIRVNYVDATDPTIGTVTLGELLQGDRHDRLLSISKLAREVSPVGTYDGGVISAVTGLDVQVSAGTGFVEDSVDNFLKEVVWSTATITLLADSTVFIFVNGSGVVSSSLSEPNIFQNLILGRISTFTSSLNFIDKSSYRNNQLPTRIEQYQREAIGAIFSSGSIVTENGTRGLNVSSGIFYFGNTKFQPSGGTALSWGAYYRNGSGGYNHSSQSTVSNSNWDNGTGTLASLTTSYFAKHALYVSGDGSEEKYHLVYSQVQYSSLVLAEGGNIPTPPPSFIDAVVLIATIIVHQGVSLISEIRDERPIIGFKASGISASSIHANLLGLTSDDHPQYLPLSGSRSMTGTLDMGVNAIVNVISLNGVIVESHESRHLPNGSDPLTTAAPGVNLNASSANGVGTANSLARSDHRHGIDTSAPSAQTPDQSNAAGTSSSLARADHIHNIPTAAAIGINGNSTNTQGAASTFSKSDHTHAILSGVPSSQTPDQSNAAGTSSSLARADHIHNIPTAAPITTDADGTNSQGVASTFSKSDHKHNILTGTPSAQTPDQVNAAGTSSSLARADHIHNIPAASPTTTLSPATTNSKGVSTSLALSDHTHAVSTGVVGDISTIQPDDAAVAGIVNRFSRSDHKHAIVADAPTTTLSPATTNAEGVGTSFARNDHTHAISTALVGSISTIQPDDAAAAGVSGSYVRGDHKHAVVTDPAVSISTSASNTEGTSTSFARADHTHAVSISNSRVASTTLITTTSTTYVVMTGQTLTPAAGTYHVFARSNFSATSNGRNINLAIFVASSIVADTEVLTKVTTGNATFGGGDVHALITESFITVNGSQSIDMRWLTNGGTAQAQGYSLVLLKVA